MFNFLWNCQTVSQSGCTVLHSHQQCMRVLVLPQPVFHSGHSHSCVLRCRVGNHAGIFFGTQNGARYRENICWLIAQSFTKWNYLQTGTSIGWKYAQWRDTHKHTDGAHLAGQVWVRMYQTWLYFWPITKKNANSVAMGTESLNFPRDQWSYP